MVPCCRSSPVSLTFFSISLSRFLSFVCSLPCLSFPPQEVNASACPLCLGAPLDSLALADASNAGFGPEATLAAAEAGRSALADGLTVQEASVAAEGAAKAVMLAGLEARDDARREAEVGLTNSSVPRVSNMEQLKAGGAVIISSLPAQISPTGSGYTNPLHALLGGAAGAALLLAMCVFIHFRLRRRALNRSSKSFPSPHGPRRGSPMPRRGRFSVRSGNATPISPHESSPESSYHPDLSAEPLSSTGSHAVTPDGVRRGTPFFSR